MSLLWPAVQSLKSLRGSWQSWEDASHWSNEHLILGVHFPCTILHSISLPFYLLGHVSLSSASQRCAEARVMDPDKTCPWQRCQDKALKNKGSLADNWLVLKEPRRLWLQWLVDTSGGWKLGLANWIPACLCILVAWMQSNLACMQVEWRLGAGCCGAPSQWCGLSQEPSQTKKKGAEPHRELCALTTRGAASGQGGIRRFVLVSLKRKYTSSFYLAKPQADKKYPFQFRAVSFWY